MARQKTAGKRIGEILNERRKRGRQKKVTARVGGEFLFCRHHRAREELAALTFLRARRDGRERGVGECDRAAGGPARASEPASPHVVDIRPVAILGPENPDSRDFAVPIFVCFLGRHATRAVTWQRPRLVLKPSNAYANSTRNKS